MEAKLPVSEDGIAMVEFALIVGVFLSFILGIVDFSRYYAVQALLTKGAQNGLILAKTLPDFAIDVDTLAAGDPQRDKFLAARQKIDDAAAAIAIGTMATRSNNDSAVKLVGGWNTYSDKFYETLILRPGDSMLFDKDENGQVSSGDKWIDHPTICSGYSPTCGVTQTQNINSGVNSYVASSSPRGTKDSIGALFAREPIVVEIHAKVRMIFPGFGTKDVVGRAVGYREIYVSDEMPLAPATPPSSSGSSGPPPDDSSSSSSSSSSSGCICSPSQAQCDLDDNDYYCTADCVGRCIPKGHGG